MRPFALLLALTQLLCSCKVYNESMFDTSPEAIREQIKVGDLVKITSVENKDYKFRVLELQKDQIIGNMDATQYKIPFSKIKGIKKGHVSWRRTYLRIGIGLIVFVFVYGIYCILSEECF